MERGTIKRLKMDKGFGFIKPDNGGAELFFHRSAVKGGQRFEALTEGEAVGFDRGNSDKGPRADYVTTDLGDD